MKFKNSLLISVIVLATVIFTACQKDSEWVQINSVSTSAELTEHLDSIFSAQNNCLTGFEKSNIVHAIYSTAGFEDVDDCHDISGINFGNNTLIAGKVQIFSTLDEIGSVNLSLKDNSYQVEVIIDKKPNSPAGVGYLYVWSLYPVLNAGASFKLDVN